MARRKGNKTKKQSGGTGSSSSTAQTSGIPPLGSFDPGLEAQRRASQRGLQDLQFDTTLHSQRAGADLTDAGALAHRNADRGGADLQLGFQRDLTDLATQQQRGTEDHQRALDALTRRYDTLGQTQAQQQAVAGVTRGGAPEAAAAKRAGNLAFDRQPIDVGYQRQQSDIGLRRGRLGESTGIQSERMAQDLESRLHALNTDYSREAYDAASKLSRATREQGFYEGDVTQQEYFQAHQYNPQIQFPGAAGSGTGAGAGSGGGGARGAAHPGGTIPLGYGTPHGTVIRQVPQPKALKILRKRGSRI